MTKTSRLTQHIMANSLKTGIGLLFLLLAACSFQPGPQANPDEPELEPQANFFRQFGGAVFTLQNEEPFKQSMVLDNEGRPIVAMCDCHEHYFGPDGEIFSDEGNISVKRYNPSNNSWDQLGDIVSPRGRDVSLGFDKFSNSLVLAWVEVRTEVVFIDGLQYIYPKYDLRVSYFNFITDTWITPRSSPYDIDVTRQTSHPSIGVTQTASFSVAWSENGKIYVKDAITLTGQTVRVSMLNIDANGWADNPSLVIDNLGRPIVAWNETRYGNGNIYVKRWDGNSWKQIRSTMDAVVDHNAANPSLTLTTSNDTLMVTWDENDGTSTNIYMRSYGLSIGLWDQLYGPLDISLNQNASNPVIKLDSSNTPVIVWSECAQTSCSQRDIYGKRSTASGWQRLGTRFDITSLANAVFPALVLESGGNPIVTWQENNAVYVRGYYHNVFLPLGGSIHFVQEDNSINPSMALQPSGNPIVAWQEYEGTTWYHDILVRRWDGTSWPSVGNSDVKINSLNDSIQPSVASDIAGNPVIAWAEGPGNGSNYNIYVKRWNGVNWLPFGDPSINTPLDSTVANNATEPTIALDSNDFPYIAWVEEVNGSRNLYVKRWNGSNWVWVGGSAALDVGINNYVGKPSLAIGSDSVPVIAWAEENASGNSNIYVKRLVGNTWTLVGTGPIDRVIANYAESPSLDLDNSNNPVVAWSESVSTSWNVYSKRWDAATSSWVLVGNIIDKTATNNAYTPSLQVGTNNNPVISWWETDNGSENIYVKRWNSTTSKWVQVSTGAVDTNLSQDATMPSMVLNAANNPIVAWQETTATEQHNIYVKGY